MPSEEDEAAIEWDGSEKFRSPTEWLRYLIYHFLAPWGYLVNGNVRWYDCSEAGAIRAVNNEVFEDGDSA